METEAVHPLVLLTRDGWILVLAHLDKPKDCWNTANVHPLFLSIFQSNLREKWTSTMFIVSIPHLLNYLPFSKVLELRLVDRWIKSTIDQCLEQGQVSALKKYRNLIYLCPEENLIPNGDGHRLHLNTPPIKPWMNLTLWCAGFLEHSSQYLPFFRQYGTQVHKVIDWSVNYTGQTERTLQQITSLRNLLTFTPNVEVLELSGYSQIMPQHCSAELITDFLLDNPLPELPLLNDLELCLEGWPLRESSAISGAILKCYGAQLQKLNLHGTTITLPKAFFLRLRELWLDVETAEQLESLQASETPLDCLTVDVAGNSPISPSQFFLALQPFQSTLKNLGVYATHWHFGEVEQLPIELPQVEVLTLKGGFYGYGYGFNENDLKFLGSFPNLKECIPWPMYSEDYKNAVSNLEEIMAELNITLKTT